MTMTNSFYIKTDQSKAIKQIGSSSIAQPEINFVGGSIKWYEDKKK